MDGAREKSLPEEILALVDYEVDQAVIERMIKKYNKMLTDHGNACNNIRDEVYQEVRAYKEELEEKKVLIRVLTSYIKQHELL